MPDPEFHGESTGPVPLLAAPARLDRFKLWHIVATLIISVIGGVAGFAWKIRAELETKASAAALIETQRTVEQHGRDIAALKESSVDADRWRTSLDRRIDWIVDAVFHSMPARARDAVEPPPPKK